MRSNNALIIPTAGNLLFIGNIIKYLNIQTSDDFEIIFIVKKGTDVSQLSKYISKKLFLPYSIITQKEEGIIGAMNCALGLPYKHIILTDDDAIPSQNYVENSVTRLEDILQVGCIFGSVNHNFPDSTFNILFRALNTFMCKNRLIIDDSYRYFNTAGLPAGIYKRIYINTIIKDYFPIGVSMSWKQQEIGNFRIPNYGKRGILFESYISLALKLRGLNTFYVGGINIGHLHRDSLSRGMVNLPEIVSEIFSSPIVLSEMGFNINKHELLKYKKLIKVYPKIYRDLINNKIDQILDS